MTGNSRKYSGVFVLEHKLKKGYPKKAQSSSVGVEELAARHSGLNKWKLSGEMRA